MNRNRKMLETVREREGGWGVVASCLQNLCSDGFGNSGDGWAALGVQALMLQGPLETGI